MKPSKPLNVALVGCGIISENHIRAYAQHTDRARIVVCCDIDRDKAAARAELVGNARVATRLEDVLADDEVDAVEICTPHHLHAEAVIAAAQAGKHILCQKPLARTLEECDAMIAAAEAAGVILFYGETNRTLPAAVQAKLVIAEGRIGTPVGIQARAAYWQGGEYMTTQWRYDPAITGGGQLLDGGIHAVDLMLHIGGPIAAVSCNTTRFRPELGGEDTAVVNVRFSEGPLGSLFTSQAAGVWLPEASFIAFGTEGAITLGGTGGALVLHRSDLPDRRQVLLEKNGDAFAVMIGRYLDTLFGDIENPSPASAGRENLSVVLAAYEAARQGREIILG
ncbi:MAG: Gfo/Idh/MocA family oxidoreductase [Armatimonadota bacterium]